LNLPTFKTGSGESPAICFINGDDAYELYGAVKRSVQQCPHCHGPVSQLLSFNVSDSYYYLAPCPICGVFLKYCDVDGNLVNKFTVVKSSKTTPLDSEEDFPNHWC
jgi:hypothetical protein